MPIPKDLPQARVLVNGVKATDLGRDPKVAKPWREEKPRDLLTEAAQKGPK